MVKKVINLNAVLHVQQGLLMLKVEVARGNRKFYAKFFSLALLACGPLFSLLASQSTDSQKFECNINR